MKYPGPDQYRIQRNPNGTTIETWGSTGRKVQTRADVSSSSYRRAVACFEVLANDKKHVTKPTIFI